MKTFTLHLNRDNLLNWPVFLMSTVWAVFTHFVDVSTNNTGLELPRAILVVGIQAALFVWIWAVCHVIDLRISQAKRAFFIVAAMILFVPIRAFVVGFGLFALGVTETVLITPRLVASLTNQVLVPMVLAIAFGIAMASARVLGEMADKRNELVRLLDEAQGERATDYEHVIERVRETLRKSLQLGEQDSPEEILQQLRNSIDEVVRPLSHRLESQNLVDTKTLPITRPQIAWGSMVAELMNLNSLRIFPTATLYFLSSLVPLVSIFNAGLGFLLAFAAAASFAALAFVITRTFRSLAPGLVDKAFFPALWLSGSAGFLLIYILFPETERNTVMVGYLLNGTIGGVIPALFYVAVKQSQGLSEQIREENQILQWELARARAITKFRRRALSRALHGNVQAALSAAALRLQNAINHDQDVEAALDWARSEADRVIFFEVDEGYYALSFVETVEEVKELWSDACTISDYITEADYELISRDQVTAQTASELVMELSLNAMKHAQAENIVVRCAWPQENIFQLQVVNDGLAESNSSGVIGVGTKTLDLVCTSWDRMREGDQTVVSANLPFSVSNAFESIVKPN